MPHYSCAGAAPWRSVNGAAALPAASGKGVETISLLELCRAWEIRTAPLRRWWRRLRGRPARPCAWCLAEAGKRLRLGDSHGVCGKHLEGMRTAALEARGKGGA